MKSARRWATSFPQLIFASIVCIGALVRAAEDEHWAVSAIQAPHIGERSEKEIISAFVHRIADLTPQLVRSAGPPSTCRSCAIAQWFAGLARLGWRRALTSIDIPKTRLTSATCCRQPAPRTRRRWHELCPVVNLKLRRHQSGPDVERYCREGSIAEVAAYCETDVVNTYRVWLRYELFRGRLTENGLQASETDLSREYIQSRGEAKSHLAYVLVEEQKR